MFAKWQPLVVVVLLFAVWTRNITAEEKQISRPNIIIVLCDDLGYGDIACFGHPVIQTPYLDQFAKEGLKLTNCYAAAANCSPSRTGFNDRSNATSGWSS